MQAKTVHRANEARGFAAKAAGMYARPRAWLGPSMSTDAPDADSSDVECPTCGKDDFQSVGGMTRHHKLVHDESIAGVEVECSWCGETKRQRRPRAKEQEQHFCDDGCESEWRVENNAGENNPNWKPLVAVECSWCGGTKEVYPYQAQQQDYFFHDGCQAEWNAENRSGENAPWFGSTGEDHPGWKGGYEFSYGSGWTEAKKERVRGRQDRKCAGCGMDESENGQRLSVHHIQKARLFDDDETRNDDSRLVALCRGCHPTWEQMSPLRPQTQYLD
jgi:hypothetical protein